MNSLQAIQAQLEEQALTNVDYPVEPIELTVNDKLLLGIEDAEGGLFNGRNSTTAFYPMTSRAQTQLMQRLGMDVRYSRRVITDLGPEYFSYHANGWLDRREKNLMIRTQDNIIRATLGPGYTPYDNRNLVGEAVKIMTNQDGSSIPHSIAYYQEPDETNNWGMTVRVLMPMEVARTRGLYKIGFTLRNDETGGSSIYVIPWVQGTSCMNSYLMMKDAFKRKHLFSNLLDVNIQVKRAIGATVGQSQELINRLVEAEYEAMPRMGEILAYYSEAKGLGPDFLNVAINARSATVYKENENLVSTLTLVNKLTEAAHRSGLSHDDRVMVEEDASDILFNPQAIEAIIKRKRQEEDEMVFIESDSQDQDRVSASEGRRLF